MSKAITDLAHSMISTAKLLREVLDSGLTDAEKLEMVDQITDGLEEALKSITRRLVQH